MVMWDETDPEKEHKNHEQKESLSESMSYYSVHRVRAETNIKTFPVA